MNSSHSRSPRHFVVLTLGLAVALALRLIHLAGQNLWYDEVFCVEAAQGSFLRLLGTCYYDVHPPLFFAVLQGWMIAFGSSPLALRLLPVLLNLVALALAWDLARRTAGTWVAGFTLAVLAVSSQQIYFAQEVRMYSLLQATVIGAAWGYRLWLDGDLARFRPLALYAICAIASLYTHYFGLLAIVAINLHFFWGHWLLRRLRPAVAASGPPSRWRTWLLAQGLVALAFLPWFPIMAMHSTRTQSWRHPMTFGQSLRNDLAMAETAVFGYDVNLTGGAVVTDHSGESAAWRGFSRSSTRRWLPNWVRRAVTAWQLATVGVLLLLLTVGTIRAGACAWYGREREWLCTCLWVFPLLAATGLAMRQSLELSRYLLMITPAAIIVCGEALLLLPRRWLQTLVAAFVLIGLVPGILDYYATPERDTDLRPILADIADRIRPGERITIDPYYKNNCLRYYADRAGLGGQLLNADHRSWDGLFDLMRSRPDVGRWWIIVNRSFTESNTMAVPGPFRSRRTMSYGFHFRRAWLIEIEGPPPESLAAHVTAIRPWAAASSAN